MFQGPACFLKKKYANSHGRAILLQYEPGVFQAIITVFVCIVGT